MSADIHLFFPWEAMQIVIFLKNLYKKYCAKYVFFMAPLAFLSLLTFPVTTIHNRVTLKIKDEEFH